MRQKYESSDEDKWISESWEVREVRNDAVLISG